jgi:hypothetical protein
VIALPPLDDGAVHDTVALLLPAVVVTLVGAPGAVGALGVTEFDGADAGPVPMALVALTVNVYVVPLVSPAMRALVTGGEIITGVWAAEPMNGVTV